MLAKYRKALVALVSLAAEVAASGLLHGNAELAVSSLIGLAGLFGVYATPNAPTNDLTGRVAALEEQTPALADLQSALTQAVVAGLQHGKAKPDRAPTGRFTKADPEPESAAPAEPAEPGPVAGVDYPVRD